MIILIQLLLLILLLKSIMITIINGNKNSHNIENNSKINSANDHTHCLIIRMTILISIIPVRISKNTSFICSL